MDSKTGTDFDSDPSFALADSLNDLAVDVGGAHARGWASAVVSGGSIFKSTGGEGWVTNGNDTKHHYWRARAGTGLYQVLGGPSVGDAELRVRILASGDAVAQQQASVAQPDMVPPQVGAAYPSQGFFAEQNFEVFFSLNVFLGIDEPAQVIFEGEATLQGPGTPGGGGLTVNGDLTDVFEESLDTSPFNQPRLSVSTSMEVISANFATTPVDTPFHLEFDQLLTDNRLDLPEPPLISTTPDTFVTGGQLVIEVFAVDQSGMPLVIEPIIPEPSSCVLAACGMAGLLGLRRRRSSAR